MCLSVRISYWFSAMPKRLFHNEAVTVVPFEDSDLGALLDEAVTNIHLKSPSVRPSLREYFNLRAESGLLALSA